LIGSRNYPLLLLFEFKVVLIIFCIRLILILAFKNLDVYMAVRFRFEVKGILPSPPSPLSRGEVVGFFSKAIVGRGGTNN